MDQIHQMIVFIAVGEELSLARAARRLNLSPDAVARAVCSLEAQLGNKLLLRTARTVQLTEAGRRYLDGLKKIMAKLAKADEAATDVKLSREGRLTVTAAPIFAKAFVIPCIVEYMRRFPDVEVWGYFADRAVNLVDEGIDVAVRVGRLMDSGLKAVGVGQVRRLLCASPAYLAMHGVPGHPADLRKHTIVATTAIAPRAELKSGLYDGASNDKMRLRLTVTSHDAAIDAALAGMGIACLLLPHVAPLVEAGRLVPVLRGHDPAPLPVQVVHREGKNGSSKVRDFIDLLVARLRANASLNA